MNDWVNPYQQRIKNSLWIPEQDNIYSICVAGSLYEWTQANGKSLFHFLDLEKLKNKKAILVIDYTLEGYDEPWLYDWLYKESKRYGISPEQIVYCPGDLSAKSDIIKTIPFCWFEKKAFLNTLEQPVPTFEDHLNYKKDNPTLLFNCPQKRMRGHRKLFDTKIESIKDKGIYSFIGADQFIDGDKHEEELSYYIDRFHQQYCLDTFVTIVSEPQYFGDSKFLSEKIFKPIACSHPFIVLGTQGYLKELKKKGYKTFDNWFDESYDEMPDKLRMGSIINTLKEIDLIQDKTSWFESMRETLEHNYKVMQTNYINHSVATTIRNYANEICF